MAARARGSVQTPLHELFDLYINRKLGKNLLKVHFYVVLLVL